VKKINAKFKIAGDMSMSVFSIATSLCKILYNMTRCASVLRSASPIKMSYHVTNARGFMIAVSNIPSSPTFYICSSWVMFSLVYGSHTEQAYSSDGMVTTYIFFVSQFNHTKWEILFYV